VGWDLLAVIPWLVFFATGAAMVGVYAVAGLVGRDAGHIGELFEGLFELASVLLMLCLFGTTVAVVVAAWIYMGWWTGLAFLPLPLFLGWAMVSSWLDDPLGS
jgi:hypothetical protein